MPYFRNPDTNLARPDDNTVSLFSNRRVVIILQCTLAFLGLVMLWVNLDRPLQFDDAFMFYRYALHLREGLGVSWNPDGTHTFGMTSPLWGVLVWAGSFLPLAPEHLLVLLSSVAGFGAAVAMAVAVIWNAKSPLLRSFSTTLFLLAFPMSLSGIFLANARNGMETMLSLAINGLYCGLILKWNREPSVRNAWLVGLVALAAFLVRPEAALPSLLVIGLAALVLKSDRFGAVDALLPSGIFCAGMLIYFVACKFYFHSAVPLAFYVKSRHFYLGYVGQKQPVQRALQFVAACGGSVVLLIWLARWRHLPFLATYLIPLAATTLYICQVTQIMGGNARYYVPYAPYLIFPALMLLDQSLEDGDLSKSRMTVLRLGLLLVTFSLLDGFFPEQLVQKLDGWAEGRKVRYAEAQREEAAQVPLPSLKWERAWRDLTDHVIVGLPRGATVAATEVGYMGAMTPQLTVIDLSGLNDSGIARHGFAMQPFLDRKPDLVWLPYLDYTYYRGVFFDSKDFLSAYTIFDGAFNYGVALRKDSPYYSQMLAGLKQAWAQDYSTYPMQNY